MKRPVPHAVPDAREIRRRRNAVEHNEVKRFTERSRRKRRTIALVVASIVAPIGLVAGIVMSPLMTLTTVEVVGASTLTDEQVAVTAADQVGSPLAFVNFDSIQQQLALLPVIESFTTEIVPPHTLIIRVVERRPLGVIAAAGKFETVDSAGVTIAVGAKRPASLPLVRVTSASDPTFAAVVDVMLSLPADLRGHINEISAESRDSVRFTLRDSKHEVLWGSGEKSDIKAVVLASAIDALARQGGSYIIDVSAPDSLVISPRR